MAPVPYGDDAIRKAAKALDLELMRVIGPLGFEDLSLPPLHPLFPSQTHTVAASPPIPAGRLVSTSHLLQGAPRIRQQFHTELRNPCWTDKCDPLLCCVGL